MDPAACEKDTRLSHVKPVRQKWFGCACCPPNIARLLSSLGAYLVTCREDTICFHLYIDSEIEASLANSPLRLRLSANLLKDGKVQLTILSGSGEGTLAFRIPEWSGAWHCSVPGKEAREEEGYLFLRGRWQEGDTVSLDFSMPVRALTGHPLIRETAHQVCFSRGPLVYCAEEKDNGPLLHLLRALPEAEARVEWQEIGGVDLPVLRMDALRQEVTDGALYRPLAAPRESGVTLRLIPYFAWANRGKGEMRVWLYR